MSIPTVRMPPERGPCPDGYRPVWQVKGDDPWGYPGPWIDYDDAFNAVMELSFQNSIYSLQYQPGRTQVFQINFDGMTQTNITSSTVRAIRRILVHLQSDVDPMDAWECPPTDIVDTLSESEINAEPTPAYAPADLTAALPQ